MATVFFHPPRRAALAAAALAACGAAAAQTAPDAAAETQVVTITGRAVARAPLDVSGFGDVPLARLPISATVLDAGRLADAAVAGLGDLTRLDASAFDAYNPPGYWSTLALRGFTIDNRSNYRRDGLPINAETVFALENKQSLEILKGTSGIQAGTSSPGGLVNLVVKRPRAAQRSIEVDLAQPGQAIVAADLGDRAATALGDVGWRVNVAGGRLDAPARDTRGDRRLAALALDWRPAAGTFVEAEFESSRQSQPSVPGFSLLGATLPDARSIDPRINLNNQAWSLPVVFDANGGSLRLTQALTADLDVVAHAARMRLRTDDRIAFPFGCSAENDYSRYCADGSFDFYDFRSEGERRDSDALDVALRGRAQALGMTHRFNAGVLWTRRTDRFGRQAYNYVGSGTIDGRAVVPPDPSLTDENTNRDERSVELHLQDAIELNDAWTLWAGLRHTRLHRESVRTDGSRPTKYDQSFTTPWLALGWQLDRRQMLYASAGEGIESEVVPNRDRYANPGETLPAARSRQLEVGWKLATDALDARVAAFDIRRPAASSVLRSNGLAVAIDDDCSAADPCTRRLDGAWRHRGIEAEAEWRAGAWVVRGSAMALRARREDSSTDALNGLRPANVPARSLKAQAAYNVAALPGLALLAFVTHEGERMVLPDDSVSTAGWTRVDLGARWRQRVGGSTLTWRVGVDNAFDRRAWKETPYQYGHAYLYPLAPRTAHASLRVTF